MKTIFETKNNQTQEIIDSVEELEYADLLPVFGEYDFKDTSNVQPRSFANLQLRAKKALKTLSKNANEKILLLCGNSNVDTVDVANDLVKEVLNINPIIAYAPTKFECFGDDKVDGVFTSKGYVIMPCSHLIDHPKWLGILNACIVQNNDLKLILCGDATDCSTLQMIWPNLYNVLHADIVLEFPCVDAMSLMASLVASYQIKHHIKPFTHDAIELLCKWSTRQSGDKRYLGLAEIKLVSLITEANLYSKDETVSKKHVLKAIAADDYRANYLAQSELRNHRDSQILLETKGQVVGQINGLSVIETAGTSYEYGEPVRITATLRAGGDGDVIDIERKAELAGQIHAKAMMIINGFLTKEFGSVQPLPVSASLVFEQSYSEIDGDSASLTGLCAVLSSLADLPIRQDLAVTGAVDQFGDVQPVGGVNEKIEGFFRICKLNGLTGTQGVVIPKSCINQLVLRPAVVNAILNKKFHIYAVEHVTGACFTLLNTPWGTPEMENSICQKICSRLDELSPVRDSKPWWQFW